MPWGMDCLDKLVVGTLEFVQGKDTYVGPLNSYLQAEKIAPEMEISAISKHLSISTEISSRILDLVQATQYWKVTEFIQCYSLGCLPGRGREWLVERSNQLLRALEKKPRILPYETPADVFQQILREEAKGEVLVVSNLLRLGTSHPFYSTRARMNGCFEQEMVQNAVGFGLSCRIR